MPEALQVRYPEARRARTKKGKAKEEEAAAQAAAQAASLAAQETGHVRIYGMTASGNVDEPASTTVRSSGDKPLQLFGGVLLGVGTNRSILRGEIPLLLRRS